MNDNFVSLPFYPLRLGWMALHKMLVDLIPENDLVIGVKIDL